MRGSFCQEIFEDLPTLEICRDDLKLKCGVDVLTWFDTSPAESLETMETVQRCLTSKYSKHSDFVTKFNTKIEVQENYNKRSISTGPRRC